MDLPLLWFLVVGVMLIVYLVLDGFDFGVGMAMPIIAKDDTDRRHMINAIAPVWDLNETWLIIAGACMFAAFPEWYATMFSGFYLPLLVLLLALIVRAVSFEYRHQHPGSRWRRAFDACIVVGSVVPAIVWGAAFASLAHRVPLEQHGPGALMTGGLLAALQPPALLGAVAFTVLLLAHGLMFLGLKTTGPLQERAVRASRLATPVALVLVAALCAWTALVVPHVLTIACAAVAVLALAAAWIATVRGREGIAFSATAIAIVATMLTLVATLLVREGGPFVMASSSQDAGYAGLTVAAASSSQMTLEVMSWTAVACLPVIAAYQIWTYWVFRRRITRAAIEHAAH